MKVIRVLIRANKLPAVAFILLPVYDIDAEAPTNAQIGGFM